MSGPSADVRLNVAASSAAAQLEVMTRQFKRMGKQAGQAASDVNRKGKQTGKTFNSWSANLGKSALAAGGVGTAVSAVLSVSRLVTAELENQVALSNQVKQKQQPYQESLRMFHLENVPQTVANRMEFTDQVDEVIQGVGVQDKTAALDIVKTFMSSMGNAAPQERVDAAKEFMELNRHLINQTQIESAKSMSSTIAAAQLLYAKEGSTVTSQTGLLFQALTSSMVSDKQAFANNIAPVGNKLNILGSNQVEGLALAAALSNRMNDQTGALVDTASANILAKLKMVESRFGIESGGKSLLERQAFIRSDDPKAIQARKHLLGAFNAEVSDGQMSAEEMSLLSDAQKNKALLPKLGGRAKTLFAAMEFFQAEGHGDGKGELNDLFRSAFGEMGAVMESKNRVNVQATYDRLASSYRDEVQATYDNDLFSVANQGLSHAQGLETIIQSKSKAQALFSEMTTPGSDFDQILLQADSSFFSSLPRSINRGLHSITFSPDDYEGQLEAKRFDLASALQSEFLTGITRDQILDPSYDIQENTVRELTDSQIQTGTVLVELLRQTVIELEGIRRDGANQKPVKPQQPAAAAIGK